MYTLIIIKVRGFVVRQYVSLAELNRDLNDYQVLDKVTKNELIIGMFAQDPQGNNIFGGINQGNVTHILEG